eukprot:scaffold7752_cov101-Isochrysis_galbana.AAC.7
MVNCETWLHFPTAFDLDRWPRRGLPRTWTPSSATGRWRRPTARPLACASVSADAARHVAGSKRSAQQRPTRGSGRVPKRGAASSSSTAGRAAHPAGDTGCNKQRQRPKFRQGDDCKGAQHSLFDWPCLSARESRPCPSLPTIPAAIAGAEQHLDNKCSLREAGREVGVRHNTVENWVAPIRRLRLLLNTLYFGPPQAQTHGTARAAVVGSRGSVHVGHSLPDCRQPPRQTPVAAHPHGRSWEHPRQPPAVGPGAAAAMRRGVGERRGWRGPRLGGQW